MDIYTPIEEAGDLIRERWADTSLRAAVEESLGGDIPEILKDGPSGLIWRQICTPDGEFQRFLELVHKAKLKPVGFEYAEDKFHAGNFTKYQLTNMAFFDMKSRDRTIVTKKKIIDFDRAERYKLSELMTLWGENLVEFHHALLSESFPEMSSRVLDMSHWIKRRGLKPEEYYDAFFSLAVAHVVYFDDYDLLDSELSFTQDVILPAVARVKERFGAAPVIVKISNPGEHERDPYWWCYSREVKAMVYARIDQNND